MADDNLDWDFKNTSEIEIPPLLIDQVIGQEEAANIIRTAAKQKRNVLLIGEPGTGKSLLGQAMAELIPKEELVDVMAFPNLEEENTPIIRTFPAGRGKVIRDQYKQQAKKAEERRSSIMTFVLIFILFVGFLTANYIAAIIACALVFLIMMNIKSKTQFKVPKLLVNNLNVRHAPFVDATGAHAGAVLGDIRHDPFQSGGLGTPAHERVEAGMIQKSNKGVLFIDEISTLKMKTQQELLSAMQEREYPITGQSELSSGAMVRTEPVPCDFVLVAAGNLETVKGMHPALRSRIRGYGYEVYMNDTMVDTRDNRIRIARFVAQEVSKDKKIPPFSRSAVLEIMRVAKKRANRKNHLTLKLRELGGIIRAAGDLALREGAHEVEDAHVLKSLTLSRTLEQQIADKYIDKKRDYGIFKLEGSRVGQINGLAVLGTSGIILPIAAEAAPAQSRAEGKIIATGKLGDIAKEAVQNVSAIIKKYTGEDITSYDLHIQFLQAYEGVEGDSASVSIATAVISAIEDIQIDQSMAMTGSLSVRGEVLPVGGVTSKIEAAIEAKLTKVIIPKANAEDIYLDPEKNKKIEIIPVLTIDEVLDHALVGKNKDEFFKKIKKFITHVSPNLKKTSKA